MSIKITSWTPLPPQPSPTSFRFQVWIVFERGRLLGHPLKTLDVNRPIRQKPYSSEFWLEPSSIGVFESSSPVPISWWVAASVEVPFDKIRNIVLEIFKSRTSLNDSQFGGKCIYFIVNHCNLNILRNSKRTLKFAGQGNQHRKNRQFIIAKNSYCVTRRIFGHLPPMLQFDAASIWYFLRIISSTAAMFWRQTPSLVDACISNFCCDIRAANMRVWMAI